MSNFFHIINFSSSVIHHLFYTFIIFYYFDTAKAATTEQSRRQVTSIPQQQPTTTSKHQAISTLQQQATTNVSEENEILEDFSNSQQGNTEAHQHQQTSSPNQNQQLAVDHLTSQTQSLQSVLDMNAVIYTTTKSTASKTEKTKIDDSSIESTPVYDDDYSYDQDKELSNNQTVVTNNDAAILTITVKMTNAPTFDGNNGKINSTKKLDSSKSSLPVVLASVFGSLAVIVLIACIITYVLIKKEYIKIFNQPRTQRKNNEQTKIADSSSTIGERSFSQR